MSTKSMKGMAVEIQVSEPWEFGTACGTAPFPGTVMDDGNGKLLVRLAKPISYDGKTLPLALVESRHVGVELDAIASKKVAANVILVPQDAGSAVASVERKDGVFVVGTIEVNPTSQP